jgi:hypothetical protein
MSNINKTFVFETVLISGGTTGTTVEFITGATFNTGSGDLILETVSGNTINVPLDGRYTLTGHTHNISEITGFTDNSINWDIAYDDSITGITVSGTNTKTITLQQRDGNILTTNFTDNSNDDSDVVTGMTFNTATGVLALTTLSGNTITEDLDGRYALSGDTSTNTDDYVTGVSFNSSNGLLEFTRLSGGTFNVDLDDRYSLDDHTHDLSSLNNDTGFITGFTDTNNNDYLTGATFNPNDGVLSLNLLSGSTVQVDLDNRYALSGDTSTNTDDYVTSASFNALSGILELTRISGSTVQVDLDNRYALSGDTSTNTDDYVTSGDFNITTGDVTLTMLSGGTVVYNLDNRYALSGDTSANTDDYLTGATFNTSDGVLEFSRLSGGTVQVNLDDRYFIGGPIIFSCETSGTTTYIGYGEINACKIRKMDTVSGPTYTAFWSNGEETLDKLWSNRLSYPYF